MALRSQLAANRLAELERVSQARLDQQRMEQEGLEQYRSGLLANKETELAQRERAAEDLAGYRSGLLQLKEGVEGRKAAATGPKNAFELSQAYASAPDMQAEEQKAMQKIHAGMPLMDVLNEHPTLVKYPPYSQRWGPLYREAINKSMSPADDLRKLATERNLLQNTLDKNVGLPDPTQKAIQGRITEIDSRIGGGADTATANSLITPGAATQSTGQPAGQTFTDKSGRRFTYTGSSDDPMSDKNPENWQVAGEEE